MVICVSSNFPILMAARSKVIHKKVTGLYCRDWECRKEECNGTIQSIKQTFQTLDQRTFHTDRNFGIENWLVFLYATLKTAKSFLVWLVLTHEARRKKNCHGLHKNTLYSVAKWLWLFFFVLQWKLGDRQKHRRWMGNLCRQLTLQKQAHSYTGNNLITTTIAKPLRFKASAFL